MKILDELIAELQSAKKGAEADHEKKIVDLKTYEGEDKVVHIQDALKTMEEAGQSVLRVKTGLMKFDGFLSGLQEEQLIIFSAPTGHGKTTFFKTLTKKFFEQGHHSIWFSFEVGMREFCESFPGMPSFYIPSIVEGGSLKWLEDRIIEGQAKFGTKIVFIDHLHYLIDMKTLSITKNQSIAIGMLLRELKNIARRNKVLIFLVAHLRKIDIESEMPNINDLRDSSFVGQEADAVVLMWRIPKPQTKEEKKAQMPTELTNEAIMNIVKNRKTGKLGHFRVEYDETQHEFYESIFESRI